MKIWLALKPAVKPAQYDCQEYQQIYRNNVPNDAKYTTSDRLNLNKYYAVVKIQKQVEQFTSKEFERILDKPMNQMEKEIMQVQREMNEMEEEKLQMTLIAYDEIIVLDEPVAFSGDENLQIQSVPVDDLMQILKDESYLKSALKSPKLETDWDRFLCLSIDPLSIIGICSKIQWNVFLFGNVLEIDLFDLDKKVIFLKKFKFLL